MRKIYLLFAGAVMSLPLLAQTEPTFDPQTDPKVIFEQNFESDFDVWAKTPVDTINGLDYFKTSAVSTSSVKIWENKEYQTGFIHKDTVIDILNGVKPTGSETDIKNGAFDGDSYTIRTDAQDDLTRQRALDVFGTDGGTKYFQYFAGDGSKASNASGGLVPEYRRNLFVRLTPGAIEENSSYRVTMYLKTTKLTNEAGEKNGTSATFRAELMRGFSNSEKDFSMGRDVSSSNTFTYSKDDFEDGEWTKITYMTYFLTNEIAEQFCYYNGYYSDWGKAWKWKSDTVKDAGFDSLCIIRQPNKFFLRVSFRGDSTVYDLDNISITKSTIGGIQHTGNMLRVDFGYQTNLKEQATAAKERTNIAAVEVPGKFFTVWGKDSTTHKWRKVEINTAEYHDDGYMYMWSKPRTVGGQQRPQNFDGFDEVRVDFTNPSGVEYDTLALKYNGTLYPNALDEAWVEAGKRVFDFKNELSTPNPNIATGVYPLKQYPPVLRPNGAPFEDGSFGLPSTLDTIRLVLSRKIEFDPNEDGSSNNKAFCQVFKNGTMVEVWPVSESTDTWTTFKRPAKYGTPLDGDYTFKFLQLRGLNDSKYGENIVLNYHFGTFDHNPQIAEVTHSDWRHEDYSVDLASGSRYYPLSIYIHSGQDAFAKGTGKKSAGKCGLYPVGTDDGFIYFSNRGKGNSGNVYSVETLNKGNYSISFKAFVWGSSSDLGREMEVYVFAKPTGDLSDGNTKGFVTMEGAAKTLIGKVVPTKKSTTNSAWPDGVETFELTFNAPAAGEYVFEWVDGKNNPNSSGNYVGFCIGDYTIKTAGDLSFVSVRNLNTAIKDAGDKLASITDDKYKGAAFNALSAAKRTGDGFIDALIAANKGHEPKAYAAQVQLIEEAINNMQLRMDTVDLFSAAYDTVSKAFTAQAAYASLDAYVKLSRIKDQYSTYNCSLYTNAQISETADILNAAVANLNTRIAKNDDFAKLLDRTKVIIDSTYVLFKDPQLLGNDLFEHDTLIQVYEAAKTKLATAATLSDDDFYAVYDGLDNLSKDYTYAMDAVVARTRQIRELFALADSLGYDFGGAATKDSIKSLISGLRKKDAVLENVIREAVVLQIYKQFAAGATIDSLDVSALIPNYYLYTEGVAGENMEQKSGIWVAKTTTDGGSSVLPGWTFASIGGSNGYWMPTTTTVGNGDGHDWVEGHTFISGLRCGPNTSGTINSDQFFMPAGLYQFGMRGYNQTSNVALEFISDSCSVGTGDAKSLNNAYNGGSKFSYKNVSVDSIKVSGNTVINIKQTSGSGSEFDMRYFFLTLRGSLSVDYAALVAEQETKLADLITFVAPVSKAAGAVAVQYFNLNGVQIAAPEAGKIVIKRTILSNGKSVVEKILVK